MQISKIFSFFIPVTKNYSEEEKESLEIIGTEINLQGSLFEMLQKIYNSALEECNIPISFISNEQENEIRKDLIKMISVKDLESSKLIAKRLSIVTTNKSGVSLLFFIFAENGSDKRILISRLPALNGITSNINHNNLSINYFDEVFIKNPDSYKAVIYTGQSLESDFWEGRAVDKQVDASVKVLSDYWIKDFLLSTYKMTSKRGTFLLAKCLKETINQEEKIKIKQELISSLALAQNLDKKTISIEKYAEKLSLSSEAKDSLTSYFKTDAEFTKMEFIFDKEEFIKITGYKLIYLDNGAIVSGLGNKFDNIWKKEISENVITFSTSGKIVDEKLKNKV
jgi:hypothetical protein